MMLPVYVCMYVRMYVCAYIAFSKGLIEAVIALMMPPLFVCVCVCVCVCVRIFSTGLIDAVYVCMH